MKARTLLSLLLATIGLARPDLPAGEDFRRDPLPELSSLEAVGPTGTLILGSSRTMGSLLVLREDSLAPGGHAWRVAAASGSGPGALDRPAEAEARLGLQVLILDSGRGSVCQFTRDLAHQGCEVIPRSMDLARPDLLAVSAGRSLVVADSRSGRVAIRRPGEAWVALLDYSRAGSLSLRAMEALGERVFMLDGSRRQPRLLLCGTEGGWLKSWTAPGLAGLHRDGDRDLLLLFRLDDRLTLLRWPDAALMEDLPSAQPEPVGDFALPPAPAGAVLDLLWLPDAQGGAGRLLLALEGVPALTLPPQVGGP